MGAIPTEVFTSKIFKKAEKLLGSPRAKELVAKDDGDLKNVIGECVAEISKVENEMKAGIDFRKALDVIKTLRGGFRDTTKPHKVTADLAKEVLKLRNE